MIKNLTIKELAELIHEDYLTTSNLVKLMVGAGAATKVGKRPNAPGVKGKTADVYATNNEFTLVLWENTESKSEEQPIVETTPEA